MTVAAELDALHSLVKRERPWERLPRTVYLDAQAIVQWNRLGVFTKVMNAVARPDPDTPRFQVQSTPFHEAIRKLEFWFPEHPKEAWADNLRSHGNLHIDVDAPTESALVRRAVELREQLVIEESARSNIPTDDIGIRKHLGEAETIAMIERVDTGSLFVTTDWDAQAMARRRGILVTPSLSLAMAAIQERNDITEIWSFLCLERLCLPDGPDRERCLNELTCRHLTDESAARGELDRRFNRGERIIRTGRDALATLVGQLP